MQQDSKSNRILDLQTNSTRFNVLVGLTGSVAALKAPLLVTQLLEIPGVDVRVVTTDHATHFYDISEVSVCVYRDKDEWEMWTKRSDPVLHIELRRWADLLVIAPLDANTLGKIASGICDNLLVDMCGAGLGHQPTSALLSCYEHSHVEAPYHCTASGHTEKLRLR
ncbi:phosphopantothenoylcysteine decarboxylase [Pimephales promelas]|nr:phosphopantothenoylcysteine decarboxylase [Pimephales promelas]